MGRNKKKKQSPNSLSNGKKLIVILLLSCSLVAFGVFAALSLNNMAALVFTVPAGILSFVLLLVLLKDYKSGNREKTTKWYIDKFLAGLVPVLVPSRNPTTATKKVERYCL